jgi:hypothetical protein
MQVWAFMFTARFARGAEGAENKNISIAFMASAMKKY